MAVQLVRLRGVPDDEAEEIRALLTENAVDYYETPAGNWGISMPALWLNDETQLEYVNGLLQNYQQQRMLSSRSRYEQQKKIGNQKTLLDAYKENPVQFTIYLMLIFVLVYFSIKPFIVLGQ